MSGFAADVQASTSFEAAMDIAGDAVRRLGFAAVDYGHLPMPRLPDGSWAPPPLKTRSFPWRWDRQWHRHSRNDPYYHACFEGAMFVDWAEVRQRPGLSTAQRDSSNYLLDQGLGQGLTVPVHLPGGRFAGMSAVSDCADGQWRDTVQRSRETFFLLAHHFHHAVAGKFRDPFPRSGAARLSPREIECLHWAALGKSAEDIAAILGRSIETVRVHLKHAYQKLGATNRAQAVARALRLGLIELPA
jgi:LuxR family transcriptional regulator